MAGEAPPIRQWLRDNGYDVPGNQRIPADVVAAYHEAFPPVGHSDREGADSTPPTGS
jgi:hypothetical protein